MASSGDELWKLNVGGQIFQAKLSTFSKSEFLATFLGDDLSNDSDASPPFLERDPELFTEILRLLRGYQFKQHPRLQWSEVKAEAQFYQVPNLDSFAPPLPLMLPPASPPVKRKFALYRAQTRRIHWIPSKAFGTLPADVQQKLYSLGEHGHAICESCLPSLGFAQADDKMQFTHWEKTVFYAEFDGRLPEVPGAPNEVERFECERWLEVKHWLPEHAALQG